MNTLCYTLFIILYSIFMKTFLAIILGLVVGSAVNMGLVMLGPAIIPPPAGADVTTVEGLKASIHLFSAKHFLFPFLAHALGTLAGAYVAARVSAVHKMRNAMIVGVFFLVGGIANSFMIPAPAWFVVIDIVVAYLPMGYVGGTLSMKK